MTFVALNFTANVGFLVEVNFPVNVYFLVNMNVLVNEAFPSTKMTFVVHTLPVLRPFFGALQTCLNLGARMGIVNPLGSLEMTKIETSVFVSF